MLIPLKEYQEVNEEIRKLVLKLKPHVFLTLKDRSNNATGFRRTDEVGYASREKIAEVVMQQLAAKLGIGNRKRFRWLGIHEAGDRAAEAVVPDQGHLHIAVRLPYRLTTAEAAQELENKMMEFKRSLASRKKHGKKVEKEMRWLDLCYRKENREDGSILIVSPEAVETYCGKHERGFIDGKPFYKQAFGTGLSLVS